MFAQAVQAMPLANAKILNLSGTVTVHQGEDVASVTALKVGDIIKQGDVISTGSQSTVKFALSNGSVIDLDPNSQVVLEILQQKPFKGQKTYQHLDRDPSQSISLLNMNYGSLLGNVKQLTKASKFNVKTPLGVAVVRGTRFRVGFSYDTISNYFRFVTNNIDGIVDVVTIPEANEVDYGMQSNVEVKLSTADYVDSKVIEVPPAHLLAIVLSSDDPKSDEFVDFEKNLAPESNFVVFTPPPPPTTDPDDNEIASPAVGK